ncbi:MAG: excinuclease ABC subunit UvrA [Pirellulales bacterium]
MRPTAPPVPQLDDLIRLRGARVHNLRNVDLDLPRDRLVVITGPSGSGKSSLAFDTLFAEGQRQYLETLSVYARQFLHSLERPELESLEGLPPTVCIDQRPGAQNPRSTVATATEIYDYLRLLYARLGEPQCYQCGASIRQQTPDQICERLMRLPEGTRLMLLAPLVRGRKGEHAAVFAQVRKAGFVRVRVDGEVYDLDHVPELSAKKDHVIEAVVDRIILKPDGQSRLGESIRLAIKHGQGLAIACFYESPNGVASAGGKWRDELYSTQFACPHCEISYEELEPRTFSFNSPYGVCPVCEGLGARVEFDPELVVPDASLAIEQGAIAPWRGRKSSARKESKEFEAFLQQEKLDATLPWEAWKPADRERALYGDGKDFAGLLLFLEKELATATDSEWKEWLEAFRGPVRCTACRGSRLRPEANHVRFAGRTIHEFTQLSVREARETCGAWSATDENVPILTPLQSAIASRLEFLCHVGVDYLTLDRAADTLSGGELQRVRLATCIGSGLVGVCYILDEPSIGLHQRDNERLIEALRGLQRQDNTVLVVEHDEAMMRQADWLVDMGPGAGRLGGEVVAQGTPDAVCRDVRSLTGQFLSGAQRIETPAIRRKSAKSRSISLEGVRTNNLRDVSVQFPLGVLVCITGVSGSGKSSLINETLVPAMLRRLGQKAPKPGPYASLRGASAIDKVIPIDQTPLGRTPRSNAATFTGAFDDIRKLFAATREAKQRGFGASRFSFNAKGGRCEACQGQGMEKFEMNFLPDLYVECSACNGKRFNRPTLDVKFHGLSIAEVLDLPVDSALEFFSNVTQLLRPLQALHDVGLGYLPLGQPSNTLSGGEAQRVKLAAELARVDSGNTLYVLDEPTTGLHFDDIRKLLSVLGRLVDKGNTVIVVEHNLDVVKCADWIIDLGPDGGSGGGFVLAAGTPEDVASLEDNATGRFLREMLGLPKA